MASRDPSRLSPAPHPGGVGSHCRLLAPAGARAISCRPRRGEAAPPPEPRGGAGVSAFRYVGGTLRAEGVPLAQIAAAVGTPCYVYSAGAMRARVAEFQAAFRGERVLFCYAVKANSNLAVIRLFADAGVGADTVSGGEIARALAAGCPAAADRLRRASPRPTRRSGSRSTPASCSSTSSSVQELVRLAELAAAMDGPPQWRCGSTRTWRPARTRRSAPAASTTSSASLGRGARGLRHGDAAGRGRARGPAPAHRLADHAAGAVRGRLPPRRLALHEPASRGACRYAASTSAAGSASATRTSRGSRPRRSRPSCAG